MFKKYDEFINEASMDNFQMYLTKLADHLGDKQLARDAKIRSYLKSMFKKDTDYQKFTDDEVKNLSGEELHNMIKYDKRFNEGKLTEKLARGLKPLLKLGSTITKKVGEDALLDLSDKFEALDDERGDDIAGDLNMAIEKMQDGYAGEATGWLNKFNKECKKALKEGNMYEAKVTAKTIDKLTNEISKLTKDLKDNFAKYKSAKTDEDKKKYMKIAGELTSEKKAKDSELEMAIQNFGADMELDMNFEGKVNESKIDVALNKMDKWLPEDPDAMERYYEILNQESWKDMREFFIEFGNEDVLQSYGLKMKDMTKLAKAAMESYGPITAQRLNESANRIL